MTGQTITAQAIHLDFHTAGTLSIVKGGTGTGELSSIIGTDHQITVLNGHNRVIGGPVTLALPQDIYAGAAPVFARLGLGTASPGSGVLHVAGQCVTGDTKLRRRRRRKGKNGEWMEDWEEVPIVDIKPGDEILSLNEETGEFIPARVNKLMRMPDQYSYIVHTRSGKSIRTTAEHPYLVLEKRDPEQKNTNSTTFEVDLSVQFEDTARNSVVALANKKQSFTVNMSRNFKKRFKTESRGRTYGHKLFAQLIILAVQSSGFKVGRLVIDTDYLGHEREIARLIAVRYPGISVAFKQVGKSSPAHVAAYLVYKDKKPANAGVLLKARASSDHSGSLAAELLSIGVDTERPQSS